MPINACWGDGGGANAMKKWLRTSSELDISKRCHDLAQDYIRSKDKIFIP